MSDPAPLLRPAFRPLGLPVGSVRALLLLSLVARLVLTVRATGSAPDWLLLATIISGAAYFAARSGGGAPTAGRPPLGLHAGTVRLLVLAGAGYTAWLYTREHAVDWRHLPVLWVLAGFVAGVLMRLVLGRLRIPEDSSTPAVLHVQGLLTLLAAGGLVLLGVRDAGSAPDWVDPLLAAALTYYAGTRRAAAGTVPGAPRSGGVRRPPPSRRVPPCRAPRGS